MELDNMKLTTEAEIAAAETEIAKIDVAIAELEQVIEEKTGEQSNLV